MFQKIEIFTPQIIHVNRVFHEINHPFWGTSIFGNTHIYNVFFQKENELTPYSDPEKYCLNKVILEVMDLTMSRSNLSCVYTAFSGIKPTVDGNHSGDTPPIKPLENKSWFSKLPVPGPWWLIRTNRISTINSTVQTCFHHQQLKRITNHQSYRGIEILLNHVPTESIFRGEKPLVSGRVESPGKNEHIISHRKER